MAAEQPTYDPETGMHYGEPIKMPPYLCLHVETRNPRWRKLIRRAETVKPVAAGDRIRLDSGLEYIAGEATPSPAGGFNVPLTPVAHDDH